MRVHLQSSNILALLFSVSLHFPCSSSHHNSIEIHYLFLFTGTGTGELILNLKRGRLFFSLVLNSDQEPQALFLCLLAAQNSSNSNKILRGCLGTYNLSMCPQRSRVLKVSNLPRARCLCTPRFFFFEFHFCL